ncbi:ATP-binding protein [Phocaeicola sp. HCN-40430]|uniref:Dph6-related ATP pyrophosphatase n=1 Tax=Phocaeicola sp. HCN-40430 TaxID=3134664 RepID=UPI0030BF7C78
MDKIKAVFNWSGGKDSAHALWKIIQTGEYEVVALLTTVNRDTHRSTMHGIPLSLLEKQAESIGFPLYIVDLTPQGGMEDYSSAMENVVKHFKKEGVTHFIFGDIFLRDVRVYREQQLSPYGIEVVEPLWGKTSKEIMDDFLSSGLKTVVVTTMADGLGEAAIGKLIDRCFVDSLPDYVDPNGENGEYHTFCYDGPIYRWPVPFRLGRPFSESYDIRMEDGSIRKFTYWFADLECKDI